MRKRAKRDLSVILGVVAILVAMAMANNFFYRSSLAERMVKYRQQVEQDRRSGGLDLLQWNLLRNTKGTVRSGPTFDPKLVEYDQKRVDLVGFMVPLDTFRQMKEFLLLPMPIECYFCGAPPMRDVMVVQMAEGETTDLFKEPVLINGTLKLNQGPGTKFFYVISGAKMGPGKEGGTLTRKTVEQQHMVHPQQSDEPLLQGAEPPKPVPAP